jgi:hypothetical protein
MSSRPKLTREAMHHKRKRISARSYATDLICLEVVLQRIGPVAAKDVVVARLAGRFLNLGSNGARSVDRSPFEGGAGTRHPTLDTLSRASSKTAQNSHIKARKQDLEFAVAVPCQSF